MRNIQRSNKVVFKKAWSLRTYSFFTEKKAISTRFQRTMLPQGIPSSMSVGKVNQGQSEHVRIITATFFKQILIICHTNKIIGRCLSDKAHSRSLCEGQARSLESIPYM
jgi:hypothetical protein